MIEVVDSRDFPIPSPLIDMIESAQETGRGDYPAFLGFQDKINALWPGAAILGQRITSAVDRNGYAVASSLGIADFTPATRNILLLAILSHVGRFTVHDDKARVLWDVKDRAAELGRQPTFSERLGECPLHSDSAFAANPEKFLCLYVQRASADGGGQSVVISMTQAMRELLDEAEGVRCSALLRGTIYPFRTPDAFSGKEQLITAPILSDDPEIRFRHDCLIDGFSAVPDLDTPERRWAVEYFSDFLEHRATRQTFLGLRDQLVIVDNRKSLHARTDYQDPERHLIRARLHALKVAA